MSQFGCLCISEGREGVNETGIFAYLDWENWNGHTGTMGITALGLGSGLAILDLVTGIWTTVQLGTGIWVKFRLRTGIWYPPSPFTTLDSGIS